MIEILMGFWTILAPFWEPSWSHVGHFSRPRRPKTPPRRPKMPSPNGVRCPLGLLLGSIIFGMPLGIDFSTVLPPFWIHFGRFLEDFLEEFAVQPASSNLFSKKACLHKFAFQKSQPKPKGPAVFAAGVGNPPAPSLPGVQERVQNGGLFWPNISL